jgi:hypothetical protein
MKANICKKSSPKILAINLSGEKLEALQTLARAHNAELTVCEDLKKSAANYLGEKSSPPKDADKYPDSDSECLIFAGFDGRGLNTLLDSLKKSSVSADLKAIYTPHNRDWSIAHLINDLTEEHRRMTGGDLK